MMSSRDVSTERARLLLAPINFSFMSRECTIQENSVKSGRASYTATHSHHPVPGPQLHTGRMLTILSTTDSWGPCCL